MRLLLACLILTTSFTASARTVLWRKVETLEKKVAELEAKVNALQSSKSSQSSSDKTTGLKVRDLNNNSIDSASRNVSSVPQQQLTEEQRKEIEETLQLYQKNREKSQKILNEIMNEDM